MVLRLTILNGKLAFIVMRFMTSLLTRSPKMLTHRFDIDQQIFTSHIKSIEFINYSSVSVFWHFECSDSLRSVECSLLVLMVTIQHTDPHIHLERHSSKMFRLSFVGYGADIIIIQIFIIENQKLFDLFGQLNYLHIGCVLVGWYTIIVL